MPKVTYDVSKIEDVADLTQAPVGIYRAKVVSIDGPKPSSNDNQMLEVRYQLTHDAAGKKLSEVYGDIWDYPILDHEHPFVQARWKEFIAAFGLKPKGTLDTDKLVGKSVQLKLKSDTDQDGDYRPRVGKTMAMAVADEPEGDEPEAEAEAEDEVDLDEMDRAGLKKFIKEQELGTLAELGITTKTTDAEIREIIAGLFSGDEADEPEEEEPEPEPEDEPEAEEEGIDLDELDRNALKALIKEQKLGTLADLGITKATTDDEIRGIIAAALGGDEEEPEPEPEDEPEAEEEGDGYDEMSIPDLKKELKERELPTGGAKAVLIKRLRKDDEDSPF